MSQQDQEKKEMKRLTDLFEKAWDTIVKSSTEQAITREMTEYLIGEFKKKTVQT